MLNNFASTQGGGTDTVTTTMILDGTIANADVASDAAIDVSKINLGNTMEMETSSGDQIFEMDNNAANSSNFQIQNGAGNARTDLYLDGSAVITLKGQSVGIGDTSPSYALDVNDTGRFTSDLIVGGNLTVGDGSAEDQKVVFNGNAQDFYVGLDDTADDLVIGLGSAVGTTPSISINEDQDVTISDGAIDFDVASHDGTNGLKLGGTLVTSSAAELNLLDGKGIADEDDMSSDSASNLSTQQSIKAYVDAQSTAYTAGDGLDLTSTTFSTDLMSNGGLEITSTELSVAQGISQYDVAQYASGVADNDFLKIDGTAVEGRSASEVLSDIAALPLAGGTMTGTLAADDQQVTKPRFTDYAETKQAMAANSVDLTLGNVQTYTLSGNQTLTFDNPSDTGNACSFTLIVTNGGSATLTWPGAVDWAGGSAPSLTSSGVDILTFTTMDAGTIWYGFAAGLDMG